MSREEILDYVKEKYGVDPDYPWVKTPNYAILRHRHSHKWFGAIVDISKNKLGLRGDRLVDAINLKCDPLLTGSLREEAGIFPAYRMNKEHWISILLSGPVHKEKILALIDMSFRLTE